MLWLKTLHIVFVVAWYAGLFYLPRLFVYHASATDANTIATFKIMERKLYYGIMMPSMLITVGFGLWLWFGWWTSVGIGMGWLHVKLALVVVLVVLHFYLGKLLRDFRDDKNRHGHVFYRWLNEVPALPILVVVVYLVVAKPF